MHTLIILIFLNLYSYTTIWHHSIPSFCHFFLLSSSIFSTLFSGSTVRKIKKKSRLANIWRISCKKLLIFLSIRISSGDEVELHLDELICSIRMNFVAQKKKTNPLSCSNLVCWVPPSTPLGLERGKVLMHPWPRSNSGYILEASTAIQWEHYMFSMQPIRNTTWKGLFAGEQEKLAKTML